MTSLQPPQPPPEARSEQSPSPTTTATIGPPTLPALPPSLALSPITTPHQLSQFRRINTLLLPIRYPESFYASILSSAHPSSLGLIATYTPPSPSPPIVVGGICCRLEESAAAPLPSQNSTTTTTTTTSSTTQPPQERRLYILTLCILAPYRCLGLASHLLEQMMSRVLATVEGFGDVYAHVWEANEEARRWYARRGFWEEEGRVEGYYRRLRPQGAVVVRRGVGGERASVGD